MRKTLIMAVAALFAATGAEAQQSNNQLASPISNPQGLIKNFDAENIVPVLTELQIGSDVRNLATGESYIFAQDRSGLMFVLQPRDCTDGANCQSMIMFAFFTGTHNAQTVAAFNAKTAAVGAYVDGDGDAVINRFDIASYGIARGTFAELVMIFIVNGVDFFKELNTAAQTVSADGYASDLASGYLNGKQISAVTGANTANVYEAAHDINDIIALHKAEQGVTANKIENRVAK